MYPPQNFAHVLTACCQGMCKILRCYDAFIWYTIKTLKLGLKIWSLCETNLRNPNISYSPLWCYRPATSIGVFRVITSQPKQHRLHWVKWLWWVTCWDQLISIYNMKMEIANGSAPSWYENIQLTMHRMANQNEGKCNSIITDWNVKTITITMLYVQV